MLGCGCFLHWLSVYIRWVWPILTLGLYVVLGRRGVLRHRPKIRHPAAPSGAFLHTQAALAMQSHVNPFSGNNEFLTQYERLKYSLLGPVLFPIRFFITVASASVALVAGTIANQGYDPSSGPMEDPWRKLCMRIVSWASRCFMFGLSFTRIKEVGRLSSSAEAPILVSNHISIIDPLYLGGYNLFSAIAKKDTFDIPLVGGVMKCLHCVSVDRESSDSRSQVKNEILRRVKHPGKYPKVLLFPEGTTTNGKALIQFKLGAFYAGVPVQPAVVMYHTKHLSPSLVNEGPDFLELLARLMCQVYTTMTIKYLDVYTPNKEEQANPQLYAENVRRVMADALGVPMTDYSYEDVSVSLACKKAKANPNTALLEAGQLFRFAKPTLRSMCHTAKAYLGAMDRDGEVLTRHGAIQLLTGESWNNSALDSAPAHVQRARRLYDIIARGRREVSLRDLYIMVISWEGNGLGKEREALLATLHAVSSSPLEMDLSHSTALDTRTLTSPITEEAALSMCSGRERNIYQTDFSELWQWKELLPVRDAVARGFGNETEMPIASLVEHLASTLQREDLVRLQLALFVRPPVDAN